MIRATDVQKVSISKLVFNPKNNNKHPPEQIDRLSKLIEFQGFRNPVIVSKRTGFVVAGHGRIEAAKKLGLQEVPVMYQDFESEAQEYAYLTSDNAIAAWAELDLSMVNSEMLDLGPDFDIDMLGIKDFVIEPIEKFEPQADEDDVPEVVHPITRKGDLWLLGKHRLLCGDSTMIDDVERLMNGEKAEISFTSPPYSDQRDYNGDKDLSVSNIASYISAAFGKAKFFVINLGYQRKNGAVFPYWDAYIEEAQACGLNLLSWNIWNKGECGSIGNQTAMFGISHEWIFVFGDKPKPLNRTIPNKNAFDLADHTTIRAKDGSLKKKKPKTVQAHSQEKTVFSCPPQKARDEVKHPARFPVEFAERYIVAMTDTGDLVHEPFCGSGTTMVACEKTDRKCYGMELDEKYCDVIIKRWQQYTGKKATLESTGQTYEELLKERGE